MRERTAAFVGVALVVVTVVGVLGHFRSGWKELDAQAARNAGYSAQGVTLAAADSIDVDNPFALAATQDIPAGAPFAVIGPSPAAVVRDEISPITSFALPSYFQYLLLPRHEVDLVAASYVLCYDCADSDVTRPVRWIYHSENNPGFRIGKLG